MLMSFGDNEGVGWLLFEVWEMWQVFVYVCASFAAISLSL